MPKQIDARIYFNAEKNYLCFRSSNLLRDKNVSIKDIPFNCWIDKINAVSIVHDEVDPKKVYNEIDYTEIFSYEEFYVSNSILHN